MKQSIQVTRRDDGSWAVVREGNSRASSLHQTQKSAIVAAKELAASYGGKLSIEGRDNRFRKSAGTERGPQPLAKVKGTGSEKKKVLAQKIGSRLKRARLMRGLSLRAMADQLNAEISHTTLQKFEKALATPDTSVLSKIAQALDVQVGYFFKTKELKLEAVEYRKSAKVGKKVAAQLSEQAVEFFERYLEIEGILGIESEDFEVADFSQLSKSELPDHIENWATELRHKWELGLNPIANVHATLEQRGVKVRLLPKAQGFDGLAGFASLEGKKIPTIAVSDEHLTTDLPRLRCTLAHELGHLVMRLPENLEHREKEGFCYRFGGAFLFPEERVKAIVGEKRKKVLIAELKQIKSEWGLSIAALMRRFLDVGLITPGAYKGFCIWNNSAKGFKKNEPQTWIGSEASDRFEQLVFRAYSESQISISKAVSLLAVSYEQFAEKAGDIVE